MTVLAQRANPHDRGSDSTVSRIVAFVAEAFDKLAGGGAKLAMITVPAPVVPLESLFPSRSPAILWDPPEGPSTVGWGCAAVLAASGSDRIATIARQADALWQRIEPITYPGVVASKAFAPRLFGGFAFAENAASQAPWDDFGDARFVLPTWVYTRDGDRAWLGLTADIADHDGVESVGYLAELERLLHALERGETREPMAAPAEVRPEVRAIHEIDPARWRKQVEDIRVAIAEQRCQKIVAARCSAVELSRPAEPTEVLGALDRRYPDCYRFAYRFGGGSTLATFVGATPERLIQRDGDRIRTEALAGSIATTPPNGSGVGSGVGSGAGSGCGPGGASQAAQALLGSAKDRSEQTFVVRDIEAILRPLCSQLDVPSEPEIRVLRHVLHLETRISGSLRAPTHVLDLVAALHPTPAVGGAPTEVAMSWIAEREAQPRGWYAAPVGWFDASGQGEFAVAIRSGLIFGHTAHVYVGAGIVRDSDPEAELEETRVKQRAVLGALGITR